MMARKTLKLMLIFLVIGLTLLIGCKQRTEEKAPAEAKKAEEQVPAKTEQKKTQPVKALIDDEVIEYWAHLTYIQNYLVAEKYVKDPIKGSKIMAEEIEKLEKKFGMTSEQLAERYEAWAAEWTKKVSTEPEKYSKQWEEILKRFEKRVEELKKGN
ncbi:MAG: hypothetical protein QME85_04065 [Candidatus Saccharicenans sp.]|nr:hypothetical protein [Candidatus Saccharicenans sp.]